MANEENDESFVPAYEKYAKMQDAILAGVDKVHVRLKKLNEDVGAEWIQPKAGPSKLSRLSGYLKKKYGDLKTRAEMYGEPKTHFEPEYSEAEKKEREELKGALEEFKKYNPKDSKGSSFRNKMAPYAESMFGKKPEKEKLSDYLELVEDTQPKDEGNESYVVGESRIGSPVIEKSGGVMKSYGLEAKKDKLLRRSKINELSQYAPERSGR